MFWSGHHKALISAHRKMRVEKVHVYNKPDPVTLVLSGKNEAKFKELIVNLTTSHLERLDKPVNCSFSCNITIAVTFMWACFDAKHLFSLEATISNIKRQSE